MTDGTSSTWIYYVDESYDAGHFCLTALGFKAATWRAAYDSVKAYRQRLKESDGVLLRTEIHARELTRGRGKLGPREIGKWRRSRIFFEILELIASLPDVHLFNVCLEVKGRRDPQLDAWDRLLNRINRLCEERERQHNARRRNLVAKARRGLPGEECDALERWLLPYTSHALVIADTGREQEIIRLRRRLAVVNFLPSQFGSWGVSAVRNIPLRHFVEDILFRESARSYFIQLADCAAFALLKRETALTPQVRKYNIHRSFDAHLSSLCIRQAHRGDPHGVVRK